jgi:hypothetical protein
MGIKYKNVSGYYQLLITNFFVTSRSLRAAPGVVQREHPRPGRKVDASNNCVFEFILRQTQLPLQI